VNNQAKKIARAEKILNQIDARQSVNQRTIETRKKILLGALVGELIRLGEIQQATIDQGLNRYLVRKHDRELFGLDAGSGEAERAGVRD
jgi:hypothetical protein